MRWKSLPKGQTVSLGICQLKTKGNRSAFAEVTTKSRVSCIFETQCTLIVVYNSEKSNTSVAASILLYTLYQGCSLGLETVSRPSFQMSRSRFMEMWESRSRSRLRLKIKCLGLVSVSYHRISFTSQHAQIFASLQNCTYIVLNARRLYCLLIHKFTYLLHCKCISRCHLVRMYASAQATLC